MAEGKGIDERLLEVFKVIDEGMFGREPELIHVIDSIRHKNDWYLVSEDFDSYCKAQEEVDVCY